MRHPVRVPRSRLWSAALLVVALLPASVGARTITVPRCLDTPKCPADSGNAYNTVDSALTAAYGGDRIYIRSGTYTAPVGGWKIKVPLEIFGDGTGDPFMGGS